MSRNHRVPGIVRVLCTDSYHHDSPEFTQHGFHHLCTLKLAHRQGGPSSDFTIVPRNTNSKKPVKDFARADGLLVFKFECPCGLDVQRLETYLVKLVMLYSAANPSATRFDLDITTI